MGDHEYEEESIRNPGAEWKGVCLKTVRRGTGRMAQLVRCLPYKHENLNSISQKQKVDVVEQVYNPRAREAWASQSLGLPGQPAQPNQQLPGLWETPSEKNIRLDMVPGEQYQRLTSSLHMHAHSRIPAHRWDTQQTHLVVSSRMFM